MVVELPVLPDGVFVEVGPLVDLPDDRDAWIAAALAEPRLIGATIRRTETFAFVHDAGWPITRLAVEVTDAAGRELEHRVVWFFELLVRGALVRARIAPAARGRWDASLAAAVLASLRSASIRLHGREPVAISELFET